MLFVSADGNFWLQHKKKNDDPFDKALNAGNVYFVDNDKYQEYLKSISNKADVSVFSDGIYDYYLQACWL